MILIVMLSRQGAAQDGADKLVELISAPHRAEYNRMRDKYRHPADTLRFFGIEPSHRVAEIWPGAAGYYAEILAPYLRDAGRYVAVVSSLDPNNRSAIARNRFLFSRFEEQPDIYGTPLRADFSAGDNQIVANGSLDFVLIFRNLHNWVQADIHAFMLNGIYWGLKPGGRLGIVAHRLDGAPQAQAGVVGGYMTEEYAIELVEQAGFALLARSDVNANPLDSKDYPRGVWTLPPTLALGDTDRARYEEIGESDRMTLLFERKERQ